MVQKFRTKIVEIEAVRYDGSNSMELWQWTEGLFKETIESEKSGFPGLIYDNLHETWIQVAVGQWIVRGAKGEFYPCDDETFHWKYEEIKEPDFTFSGTLEYRDGVVTAEGFDVDANPNADARRVSDDYEREVIIRDKANDK